MKWTIDTVTMVVEWKWNVKPGRMNQGTDDLNVQMIVRRDES